MGFPPEQSPERFTEELLIDRLQPNIRIVVESEFLKSTGVQLIPLLKKCTKYFEYGRYSFEIIGASFSLSEIRVLAQGLLHAVEIYGTSLHNSSLQPMPISGAAEL